MRMNELNESICSNGSEVDIAHQPSEWFDPNDSVWWEMVVRKHGCRMLAVARRICTIDADAREAVQDAFLNAFRAIDRFDQRAQLSTWLHRITVNACLMKLRYRRRHPERLMNSACEAFTSRSVLDNQHDVWDDTCLEDMSAPEGRRFLMDRINELENGSRLVFLLRNVEGLSTTETARALGLSESAVKTRLHRARRQLRTALDARLRKRAD